MAAEIDLKSLKIHAQIVETRGKAEVKEAKFVVENEEAVGRNRHMGRLSVG